MYVGVKGLLKNVTDSEEFRMPYFCMVLLICISCVDQIVLFTCSMTKHFYFHMDF